MQDSPTVKPITKSKDAARLQIIQAVNAFKLRRRGYRGMSDRGLNKIIGPKQIQRAVCIARRQGLVSAKTLKEAGYNAS